MATLGLTKELYFTTSTVIDWMDVFTRPAYKRIIVESLKYCQAYKGLEIYAWVLMTNHLHMIVSISQDGTQVGDVLRDFKKFTSKAIDRCWFRGANDTKITNYKFWQDGSYIENICTYDFYKEKLNYIHMNPVRQEIVEKPEDYVYSSARNYNGQKGMIDVIVQP